MNNHLCDRRVEVFWPSLVNEYFTSIRQITVFKFRRALCVIACRDFEWIPYFYVCCMRWLRGEVQCFCLMNVFVCILFLNKPVGYIHTLCAFHEFLTCCYGGVYFMHLWVGGCCITRSVCFRHVAVFVSIFFYWLFIYHLLNIQ